MKQIKQWLLLVFVLCVTMGINAQLKPVNPKIYVNKNVSGGNEDGSSWSNAYPELADALMWAKEHESEFTASAPLQIFVAEGTYTPLYTAEDGPDYGTSKGRGNTFSLVDNVEVYGGFNPDKGATSLTNRDWVEYPTILDALNYLCHVVIAADIEEGAVLDGFVIQGGNATVDAIIYVNGNQIYHRQGGGLYLSGSSVTLRNLYVKNNTGGAQGGGVLIGASRKTTIINSIFEANHVTSLNGHDLSIGATHLEPIKIVNSTFYKDADEAGTGPNIQATSESISIYNSIISGGTQPIKATNGNRSFIHLYNSYVVTDDWGYLHATDGGGNILSLEDPFVDAEGGDFMLTLCSPAINAGENGHFDQLTGAKDFHGNARLVGASIDLGAIEYPQFVPSPGIISGDQILKPDVIYSYTTTGDAGGTWSSQNGYVQINSDGEAEVDGTLLGNDVIYYSFDLGSGCILQAQYPVVVEERDIEPNQNNILFVDAHVNGGNEVGNSWTNAIPDLADALKWAIENDTSFNASNPLKIFVAKGTYTPKYSFEDGANFGTNQGAKNSFVLPNLTQIFGGFDPQSGADDFATRNWNENETILDGNQNVYHVVTAVEVSGENILDGFIIKGGNASVEATNTTTIKGNGIINSRGAGIYSHGSYLTVRNCWIKENTAFDYGGGYTTRNDNSTILNTIFTDNSAGTSGTHLFVHGYNGMNVVNSTFYGGTGEKEMVTIYDGKAYFINNIFQSEDKFINIASGYYETEYYSNYFTTAGSWVYGWGHNLGGNILNSENPFVNAAANDFSLVLCSDAIDAGDSSHFSDLETMTDYNGNPRLYNGKLDMGAIEKQSPILEARIFGPERLLPNEIIAFTTDSKAGGVWASEEEKVEFDADGNGTVITSEYGTEVITYTVEEEGCSFVTSLEVSIYPNHEKIIYVNKNVDGGDENGSSWLNAYENLSEALAMLKQKDELFINDTIKVFIAEGSYSPSYGMTDGVNFNYDGVRNAFVLIDNVQLYGGFSPTNGAVDLSTRNWRKYPTILDGNGSYHVIVAINLPESNLIDGFIIQGGNAYQPSSNNTATFRGVNVINSRGAGVYAYGSKMTVSNCWFRNNNANDFGAGYNAYRDSSTIVNSIFSNNSAASDANALFLHETDNFKLINNTFYNDSSTLALIQIYKGEAHFANNIFYGTNALISKAKTIPNHQSYQSEYYANYFSAAEWNDDWGVNISGNILDVQSPFRDELNGNFQLKLCSPAINAGDNTQFIDAQFALDFYNQPRLTDGVIDIGAIESTLLSISDLGLITGETSIMEGDSTQYLFESYDVGVWSSTTGLVQIDQNGFARAGYVAGLDTITFSINSYCPHTARFPIEVLEDMRIYNPGTISGKATLLQSEITSYVTDGVLDMAAKGVWSSKQGLVSIREDGKAFAGLTLGVDTLVYTVGKVYDRKSTYFEVEIVADSSLPATEHIIFVDKNVDGGNNDGSSWIDAYQELADALLWAKNNESSFDAQNPLVIFVAEGTYSPLYSGVEGPNFGTDHGVLNAFFLAKNIQLYGGFSPAQNVFNMSGRNWSSYPTILDGNDYNHHLFIALDLPAVNIVDGFVVKGGFANGQNSYGSFVNPSRGGAMSIYNSSLTIQNCHFKENFATSGGGALYVKGYASPKIVNSIFENNISSTNGTAIIVEENNAQFEVINSTFYNDPLQTYNKGLINFDNLGNMTASNSIFYGGNVLFHSVSGVGRGTYRNSYFNKLYWGDKWGTDQGNNVLDVSTPFVDAENGDFRLITCTPAVNGGNLTYYAENYSELDLHGNSRVIDGAIDIGAIETLSIKPQILGNEVVMLGKTTRLTTDGAYSGTGVWSSVNQLVDIDQDGYVTANATTIGRATIHYTIEVDGCEHVSTYEMSVLFDEDNTIYVDKNATGDNSGLSWANAMTELGDALYFAKVHENVFTSEYPLKIFVAEGTYMPLYFPGSNGDTRNRNTFLMVKNTQLYGGFSPANGVTKISQRNWEDYPTILDGNNYNYHVIVSINMPEVNVIDGFVIKGGNASTNFSDVENIEGVSVSKAHGGGVYNYNSSMTISNCKFYGHRANSLGGAYYANEDRSTIINSLFYGNSANTHGHALYFAGSIGAKVINNTFYHVSDSKPTIYVLGGDVVLANNILYGNAPIAKHPVNPTEIDLYYNYVNKAAWSAALGNDVEGNIFDEADPFVDATDGDFRLVTCSPLINAGADSFYTYENQRDVAANIRLNGTIDIGAYEYYDQDVVITPVPTICIDTATTIELEAFPAGGQFTGVGVSNGVFDPLVAGEGVHLVTYTLSGGSGCQEFNTIEIEVSNCTVTAIEEVALPSVQFYPNPANEVLNVLLPEKSTLKLFDLTGRIIQISQLEAGSHTLSLSGLNEGVYLLQVWSEQNQSLHKIIKQ